MNLFQTFEWEQFKLATGYQKSYRIDDILVLQKNLPLGRSMLYSPMADRNQISNIKYQNFNSKIKLIGKENRSIFYRLELDVPFSEAESSKLKAKSYIKAFEEMQPEHTLILDISKTEGEILAQMKPKGRYNIKVAEKNGVYIVEDSDTRYFFQLYSEMAKRHSITYRTPQYFQKLFDILNSKGYCKVFTAYNRKSSVVSSQSKPRTIQSANNKRQTANEIPIASVIISFFNNRATYLFGGSSDEYKNLMAPYLLQWTAIREAKSQGCAEYDFFGIAPPDKPHHPWRGVTDFKKKFGGQEVEIAGSWDLVLRPAEYQVFKIAEKIRR